MLISLKRDGTAAHMQCGNDFATGPRLRKASKLCPFQATRCEGPSLFA